MAFFSFLSAIFCHFPEVSGLFSPLSAILKRPQGGGTLFGRLGQGGLTTIQRFGRYTDGHSAFFGVLTCIYALEVRFWWRGKGVLENSLRLFLCFMQRKIQKGEKNTKKGGKGRKRAKKTQRKRKEKCNRNADLGLWEWAP